MSAPMDRRDLLKNAVAAMEEMRARVDAAERATSEPIAIVGIGCRLPGGVTTPDELWDLLAAGRDAITEVPEARWAREVYEALGPEVAAARPRPHGGFVDGFDEFDPHFFSISPREAASMDPQHRMVLESSWHALEHAAIAPDRLRGSLTGVFIGITSIDYPMHSRFAEGSKLDAYAATGAAHNAAAGRVSYLLGLQGPSMAIDTACSSSLTAVHLACQSLRLRECDLALAGGVNTLVIPDWFVSMSRWGMLSPDGRCRAFDRDANGMVRSEGCGIIALKRASDAEAAGDRILAVILGSAVNQDGASGGLTVPNGRAQEAVVRQALRASRVRPADVSYIEAHGTGTPLGDPIELEALEAVLAEGRSESTPLVVGSIKTNLGHLESAAGVAGLIKVVLALQNDAIPAHVHFSELSPAITLRGSSVVIPKDAMPWKRHEKPRIAGVSSFGLSGTNAHVVLSEAKAVAPTRAARESHLLTLSARSESALKRQALQWRDHLASHPALDPGAVAHSANTGRAALPYRVTMLGRTTADFVRQLDGIVRGAAELGTATAHTTRQQRPRVAMMFTGQGSQFVGMGRELYASQPVFRAAFDRCDEVLQPWLGQSLVELIDRDPLGRIDQTAYTQPALFALEYALCETWRSWGIAPAAVMGHSVGEYVAACVAGVFSFEDGLRLIAERGRLLQQLPAGGAMAAVLGPEAQVRAALANHTDVAIAALNGPDNVVISGPIASVDRVAASCEARGIVCRRLTVSHAFHSALMEPALTAFAETARAITFSAPQLPLVSNVTGQFFADGDIPDAAYWTKHLREAVRFADGVAALERAGYTATLEVGPTPALTAMARRVASSDVSFITSLRRGQSDWQEMLSAAGALYARGANVDWEAVDRGMGFTPVSLPGYPFERARYWIEPNQNRVSAQQAGGAKEIDPVSAGESEWLYELSWRPAPGEPSSDAPHRVLILADGLGVGLALAQRLRSQNIDVQVMSGLDQWTAPADRERADAVVVLRNLDLAIAADQAGVDIQQRIVAACDEFVSTVRALVSGAVAQVPRLIVVTAGAHAIDGGAVSVAHAPLAALANVASAEHPDLGCLSIDVEAGGAVDEIADALLTEILLTGTRETRVAWRGGHRLVARLTPRNVPSDAPAAIRGDATYLVTGGAGGLGVHVADDLIARGARHLVLVGRRPASDAIEARCRVWREQGCEVLYVAGDVADDAFIGELTGSVTAAMPAIAGVCHAAGVVDDGVLLQQSAERFHRVMAAKVAGAWNLHRAFGESLDFFVMFSSLASVLGAAGQGNYAAANAFLDALAAERQRQGLRATSIAWGPWDESGMAVSVSAGGQRRWAAQGIGRIDVSRGLALLHRLCTSESKPTAVVAAVNWPTYARARSSSQSALFDELVPVASADAPAQASRADLQTRLRALAPADQLTEVIAVVRAAVGQVLGLRAEERVDPRQGLQDFGVDSLMALELRNVLQLTAGQTLPATFAFDYPSIDAMATYLMRIVGGSRSEAPASAAATRGNVLSHNEPIAIVGVGCRVPGAESPDAFWRMLRDGIDGISEVPPARWNVDEYYDSTPGAAGKMISRCGGFVPGIELFDPQFFGIAGREAATMDPQQRMLLEVAWQALEHAAIAPDRLHGSRTGVYVGISTTDYLQLQLQRTAVADLQPHVATGGASSVAAGRLSFGLGLQGPAMVVDTACSSSLVAVHLACQSLRHGDCETALAGGVNVVLAPEANVILSRARMLSPDGRCKTFDASADGYVRSEGCGIVVLKRLSDAMASGDRVLAVIRGTAVNQDGRSGGLTVPNGPAQESLIRDALRSAELRPADIDYIEAHGTGTSLGDPIEVRALTNVFAEDRDATRPLLIGSVKTNVGHLEPAAGIAGLIKVVLALQHGEIPPHLHLKAVNPLIQLEAIPAAIPTAPTAWTGNDRPRRAGVSSFGFSGTNAHAIIEESPSVPLAAATDRSHHVLTLSAKTAPALRDLGERYLDYLNHTTASLGDVASTASSGRSHFDHRVAVAAATVADARAALASRLDTLAIRESAERPKLAFLFTGQGAQYPGMARQLYASESAFASALDECAQLLDRQLPEPLHTVLFDERRSAALINQTGFTQPALFALEYSLARMWQSWGIRPSAVMGHSVGEFAAACIAGALTLDDAASLIATRGRLMQALPDGGAMAAVFASEARVAEAIADYRDDVAIAAVNGDADVVISGAAAIVARVTHALRVDGIESRPLSVSHAFHSPLITPMLDEFERVGERIAVQPPSIPLISNVTGSRLHAHARCDGAYWRAHAAQPVRFADGMRALADEGCRAFLEIGPNPTLVGMGSRVLTEPGMAWLSSLRNGRDDWQQLSETIAALYESSFDFDWRAVLGNRRVVSVPTYPFQRERYWVDGSETSEENSGAALDRWATDHAYSMVWQRKPSVSNRSMIDTSEAYVVLVDDHGFGAAIVAELRARGARVIEVHAGATTAEHNDHWQVVPDRRDGFECLLSALRVGGVTQIINCWPLDAPAVDEDAALLDASHIKTCGGFLHLTQALTAIAFPGRVWTVTRGAIGIRDDERPSGALQSPAWGFGRVVALEHPEIWGGLIDLDRGDANDARDVLAIIANDDGEDQIALRDGERFVGRLIQTPSVQTRPVVVHRDATYLVTGGTGNLGLRIATELARLGAGHLVLASRSARATTPEQDAAVREIEAMGSRVTVFHADVTVAADVERLGATLPSWAPLRGIVHAAAAINGRMVAELQLAELLDMLRPKVAGTILLDRLTTGVPLDFFVMMSSIAGVFGAVASAHYAAANVFLDAFAHLRRGSGRPITSVSWGTWDVIRGTAADLEKINRGGMNSIATPVALDAFRHLLHPSASHVVFGDVDWQKLKPLYETKRLRPFFAAVGASAAKRGREDADASAPLHAALRNARPAERRTVLQTHIREIAAAVLGLRPAQVDVKKGLFDLGMDSLMSVDLKDRLEATLGHTMPATLTFNYPSVAAMTEFLAASVLRLDAAGDGATGNASEAPAAVIAGSDEDDQLSEDELVSLLAARLDKIPS